MQINSMDAMTRSIEYSYDKAGAAAGMKNQNSVASTEKANLDSMENQGAPQNQTPEEQKQAAVSNNFVKKVVEKANKQLSMRKSTLEFSVHDRLNEVMVKVIDTETKKVIREIPSEKILDMMANMLEMAGLLVDEKG